jgi:hypothetical protein
MAYYNLKFKQTKNDTMALVIASALTGCGQEALGSQSAPLPHTAKLASYVSYTKVS